MIPRIPEAKGVKDRRKGFCFQTVEAMDVIRARWDGEELTTAIALYQAMTDLANRHFREGGRDGFEASRRTVARFAGMSIRTVDKYTGAFEKIGLLTVRRERRPDGLNLPNVWVLEDPEGGATAAPPPARSGAAVAPPVAHPVRQGGAVNSTRVDVVEDGEEGENAPLAPQRGERPEPPDGGRKREHDEYAQALQAWAPHPEGRDAHLAALWDQADAALRERANGVAYESYLATLHPHRLDGDTLVLGVPPRLISWIDGHFRRLIEAAAGCPILLVACEHQRVELSS